MALRLASYRDPRTGADAGGTAYLTLDGLTYRADTRQMVVTYRVYADQAAYLAGKDALERAAFTISGADFAGLDTGLRRGLYGVLKARRFPGAADVLEDEGGGGGR